MIISRKRYEENIQAATERGMLREQEAIRRRAATIKDLDDLKRILSKELQDAMTEICEQIRRGEARTKEKIEEARIERSATEKSGTTVYMRMLTWTKEDARRITEDILNRSSPDRIVLLPSHIEILNPEELQTIKTQILGE